MSAADLEDIVTHLPPGADIFQVVHQYIDSQIFPDLGRAFWVQFYVAMVVLFVAITLVIVSFTIKAFQGRVNLVLSDGSFTRIDLKFAIPVLWSLGAAFQIIFAFIFRQGFNGHRLSRSVGIMWYLPYIPPAISYTLLSASVVANVPPLRRHINGVSYSIYRYNGAVALSIIATICAMLPPAILHGRSLLAVSKAFNKVSEGIQAAAIKQDYAALLALEPAFVQLDRADKNYRSDARLYTGIYAGVLLVQLFTGVIAFGIVRRTVHSKIAHLENDTSSTMASFSQLTRPYSAESEPPSAYLQLQTRTGQVPEAILPPQPKDRPFAQLVSRQTTIFPHRFHVILQDKEQTAATRARRLRALLTTDLRLLLVYFVILITLLVLSLYVSMGGRQLLDTKQAFLIGYAWLNWNLALPTCIMSVLLFRESLYPPPLEKEQSESRHKRKISRPYPSADLTAIQCDQIVDVVYTAECKESIAGDADEEKGYRR